MKPGNLLKKARCQFLRLWPADEVEDTCARLPPRRFFALFRGMKDWGALPRKKTKEARRL